MSIPSKPIKLVRFRWNLKDLPADLPPFPKPYKVRGAEKHELTDAVSVVKASYNLDPEWSGYGKHLDDVVLPGLKDCFDDNVFCLFVFHGNRVIAASAYTPEPGDGVHLVTGPCVLTEYRNRGIGGALLAATLAALREQGVKTATAQTRPGTPSAKFLYSKFGGEQVLSAVAPPPGEGTPVAA